MYTSRSVYELISQQTTHANGGTGDPIIEWKTCRISGQPFAIFQSDLDFYAKISPTFAGQKFQIPTPTLCPEERQRRRLAFRNERKLYKRKCDATGKDIICIYAPDSSYKVYDQNVWRSDSRDPMKYGRTFDLSISFSQQFDQLFHDIPHMSLSLLHTEQCDYSNYLVDSKNCYLVYGGANDEHVLYAGFVTGSDRVVDADFVKSSQHCYSLGDSEDCYQCFHGIHLQNCRHCLSCRECVQCEYCIDCLGLHNKRYCINNQQVSPEEFQRIWNARIIALNLSVLKQSGIMPATSNHQTQQCFGNGLTQSSGCVMCFDMIEGDSSKYCSTAPKTSNSYDIDYVAPYGSQRGYELCTSTGTNNSIVTYLSRLCTRVYYCIECLSCQDCFGCMGLRNKQYCVFNRQYSKEEYENLTAQIVQHMQSTGERGEFFDPSISPFGYNETVAQEYFPLTKESSLMQKEPQGMGFYKRFGENIDPKIPEGISTLFGDQISNDISTVTDDILTKILICEVTGRPYRIVKQELDFYRKHHLPLPRRHPDQRHADRMALRAPRELHLRTCDKTGEQMISVYPQDVPFKVYSEKAYRDEVFA